MKYMFLIHQVTTPTPLDPEPWASLAADEQQAIYRRYYAINETPGVSAGRGLEPPETATTVRVADERRDPDDRRTRSRRRKRRSAASSSSMRPTWTTQSSLPRAHPGRPASAAAVEVRPIVEGAEILEQVFRDESARRRRLADRLPRRLRPRRGGRAGGLRDRRRALAPHRDTRQPRRLAAHNSAAGIERSTGSDVIERWPRRRDCSTCLSRWTEEPVDEDDDPGRAARARSSRAAIRRSSSTPRWRSDAADARRAAARRRSPARSSFPRDDDGASGSLRAKRKIKAAGIPFRVPPAHLLPDRLAAVLAVVYLIFNEGYGGRGDLAGEAIRLGQCARRADAGRARGARAAGADAAERRPE